MTTRAAESDATRRQILGSVVDVAATSGLDALTLQAVAAHADVALRTIYNHFGSREELIAAALGDLAEQSRAAATSIEVADQPAREQLLAFVDAYLRSYEVQGPAVAVLMQATAVPVVAAAVDEVRTWRRQRLRTMLRRAHTEGALRVPVTDAVPVAYLATAFSTYATLVDDIGLAPAAARTTIATILDRTLFGGPPDGG
jgi:AcrR family transcriptional regulator